MSTDNKDDLKRAPIHPTKSSIRAHDYEEEMEHGRSGLAPSHTDERGKPAPQK